MLPFTREQFFEVFAVYNSANWAVAIAVYPLALLALAMAWCGRPQDGRWVGAILALMWGWVGIVYQGMYFSEINPVARAFAGAFVLQAMPSQFILFWGVVLNLVLGVKFVLSRAVC